MKCVMKLSEVPLHLYQIIAGFSMLDRLGEIELEIKRLRPGSNDLLPYNMLEVEADGKRLIYDMNDGYDNLVFGREDWRELYNGLLERCDFFFKRSFNAAMNMQLSNYQKIIMTAPNFFVTIKANPAHFPVPCDPKSEKLKKLIRMLPGSQFYNGHCLEEKFKMKPVINENPRILFMARLWNPKGEFEGQLNEEKSEERHTINEMRAKCIRLCRKEFGECFFGGVAPSAFSAAEYGDIVLADTTAAKKDVYLQTMKSFDIHIATAGLHKSTGWKFAEYLAASKAIASEPLYYSSAGGLSDGVNYLSFRDEAECIERIRELLDSQRRYEMMSANDRYYDENMKCAVLVRKTLSCIERSD